MPKKGRKPAGQEPKQRKQNSSATKNQTPMTNTPRGGKALSKSVMSMFDKAHYIATPYSSKQRHLIQIQDSLLGLRPGILP